jgi:glycosyltransferase involved in cell wall biosynthesis
MNSSRTVLVQLNSLEIGGTQLNAVDLARAVAPLGFRSVLFGPADSLPDSGPSLLDVAAQRGVEVHAYDRADGVLIGGAEQLERRAAGLKADIVHVYGEAGEPRHAFWGPCRAGRRPFVHTIYEMAVDPKTYRHTSLIIGTGYLRDELAARPGLTALISPPVDTDVDRYDPGLGAEFRAQWGLPETTPLAVIVSRLDKAMKAVPVETAIRAMPLLAGEVALVVVGTGTEEASLRELASRVEAEAGRRLVYFTGAIADPRGAYSAADVVLGMGGSAARALSFGRPLIVQGEQGTSELFTPASADDLFRRSFWSPDHESDASAKLAAAIRSAIDPASSVDSALGVFGREYAVANFSLDAMGARLADVYTRALSSYGRAAWFLDLHREVPALARSVRRRIDPGWEARRQVAA